MQKLPQQPRRKSVANTPPLKMFQKLAQLTLTVMSEEECPPLKH